MSEYHPRFKAFDMTDATYNEVDGHEIKLSILTPKELPAGAHPVIVRFHGGALVTGSRMYPDWFPMWLLDHALTTKSILITPDYRLLPESSGADVLEDLRQFFKYLATELPFTLSTLSVEADLQRVLVTGESAGGWLAAQSALLQPAFDDAKGLHISAAVLVSAMLDLRTEYLTAKEGRMPFGVEAPPASVIDTHLEHLRNGDLPKIVTGADPDERTELGLAYITRGRFLEALGDASELYPMDNIEHVKDGQLCPIWLVHGTGDTIVPVENSKAFAEKVKTLRPEVDLNLALEDGQEHGFDGEATLDTPWVRKGLAWLSKYWPEPN